MAIRRDALQAAGPFDETIHGRGEEEEWQRRHRGRGGKIRYLAAAGVIHRRSPADATLRPLARAGFALGRSARRWDVRKGSAPAPAAEGRVLVGCLWHAVRRRCTVGLVLAAHSAGRLREAIRPGVPACGGGLCAAPASPAPAREDFLSGTSGQVFGPRALTRAVLRDGVADADALLRLQGPRVRRAAVAWPRRRVLVVAVERAGEANVLGAARAELARSRHEVVWCAGEVGDRGKFENLGRLLEGQELGRYDWLMALDDDVALPHGFLDRFLFLAERYELSLAQPAHRWRSHAGWPVTRRRRGSLVRETGYVEIGPLTAFHAATLPVLLPFPPLRFGWGLDLHWAALAREHGWRIGVVDATAVRHGLRRIASAYSREEAVAEAREFLAGRPYVPAAEAGRTLATHRSLSPPRLRARRGRRP
jgi:hypothetical protein